MVLLPNVQVEPKDLWINKGKPSDTLPNEFKKYSESTERKENKFWFKTNPKTMDLITIQIWL